MRLGAKFCLQLNGGFSLLGFLRLYLWEAEMVELLRFPLKVCSKHVTAKLARPRMFYFSDIKFPWYGNKHPVRLILIYFY